MAGHYPIELMSQGAQNQAKSAVASQMRRTTGYGFGEIPGIVGIGISYGNVRVVIDEDYEGDQIHDFIPRELDSNSSFQGLPVEVEYGGRLYPLDGFKAYQGRMSPGGGGSIFGGAPAISTEYGTTFGVLHSISNPSQKFAVVSSHITSGGKRSCTIGGYSSRPAKDCGCGKVWCEGTSLSIPSNANSSYSIKGLGVPKGLRKAKVGDQCISDSQTSGRINGMVTMINFTPSHGESLGQGQCSVLIQDMFQADKCGTQGDSGGAQWTQDGFLIGIITYGSTPNGNRDRGKCISYNPSANMALSTNIRNNNRWRQ